MTYLKVRHGDWTYYVAKANFERDRLQELQVEGKHESHKHDYISHHQFDSTWHGYVAR